MSMSQFAEITGLFSKVARDYRTPFTEYSNLPFQPYEVEGRQGVSIHRLYDTRDATPPGPAAAIVRYAPGRHGTSTPATSYCWCSRAS